VECLRQVSNLRPSNHLVISAGIAGINYAVTGSPPIAISTLSIGFLMDVDHIFDYAYYLYKERRQRQQIKAGQSSSNTRKEIRKTFIFLHSYELLIPIWLICVFFFTIPLAIWLTISFLVHLILDQVSNRPHQLGYFLIFRIANGFRRDYVYMRK